MAEGCAYCSTHPSLAAPDDCTDLRLRFSSLLTHDAAYCFAHTFPAKMLMNSSPALPKRRQPMTPWIAGESVTFVWRGSIPPRLIGDFNDWDAEHALELTETFPDLWTHTLTLPADAYIEYAFLRGEDRVPDPANPRTASNGMGKRNNFFYMPQAAPTPLAQRQPDVTAGQISRHVLQTGGILGRDERRVYLYQPPISAPVPLLVVYDGDDYLRRARLPVIVDNLIAAGRIQPIALAFVANGGRQRIVEYSCSDATLRLLIYAVLPLARNHLNLVDPESAPGSFGVMGASLGGLMALYTGMRMPGVFGQALSQSGAFWLGEEQVVVDLARHMPKQPLRIWMDVGRFEDLCDANQRMFDLLVERGYEVTHRVYNAGHNYSAWRDDLWRGLEWLFPPMPA